MYTQRRTVHDQAQNTTGVVPDKKAVVHTHPQFGSIVSSQDCKQS